MGYQALLFCPDEKTARTVTQVLNELEFSVEACTEPFTAVKKLMGQHFDAVVVDCDNEQNATLLFKSARNSTSNQTSLAVAVVEGQAGVAKAFRIGANLVLTKPINIEQSKGTLRVARGLLRKSDPTKPAAGTVPAPPSAATPAKPAAGAPAPPKPAPLKPISAAKPAPPVAPVAAPKAMEVPPAKPAAAAAWPSDPAPSARSIEEDEPLFEIDAEESGATSAPTATQTQKQAALPAIPPAPAPVKPAFSPASPVGSSGAASAPAPARDLKEAPSPEKKHDTAAAAMFEPAEAAPTSASAVVGSAPSFSFGGANAEPEPKSGSKKILLIGIAVAVIIAAVYVGWSHLQSHKAAPATTEIASAPPAAVPQPSKPAAVPAAPAATAPAPTTAATSAVTPKETLAEQPADDTVSAQPEVTLHSAPSSPKAKTSGAPAPTKIAEAAAPAPGPMVVKSGKGPAAQAKPAADDAAPSLIGMATPGAGAPLNIVPSGNAPVTPVLQTLNVSQGVSQGLLIKKISPTYPSAALRLRIEGTVQLLATVSKEGNITHVKVLSGDSQLTRAATDAVKQWKYKPYLLNGEPVEIQTQVTINFKLPQ